MGFDTQVAFEFFRRLTPPDERQPAATSDSQDGASPERDVSVEGGGKEGHLPLEKRDLRFVLALLLIRKKSLNFESSGVDNGREWLKLSEKADPDRVYWVENPNFDEDELERVREDIGELLQMTV